MNGKVVPGLTIKEVSETYDISADTLRYYERIGMIPEVTRTAGGIRYPLFPPTILDFSDYKIPSVGLILLLKGHL